MAIRTSTEIKASKPVSVSSERLDWAARLVGRKLEISTARARRIDSYSDGRSIEAISYNVIEDGELLGHVYSINGSWYGLASAEAMPNGSYGDRSTVRGVKSKYAAIERIVAAIYFYQKRNAA